MTLLSGSVVHRPRVNPEGGEEEEGKAWIRPVIPVLRLKKEYHRLKSGRILEAEEGRPQNSTTARATQTLFQNRQKPK